MRKQIITNILQSLVEKFFTIGTQLILSILLVRLLSREDYGNIGVVAGFYVFINFFNISLESIILKDHNDYSKNLNKYFFNFLIFNIFKSLIFILLSTGIAIILVKLHNNYMFVYSIISITITLIADSFVAPILIYSTSTFKQNIVTRIAIIRSMINLVLSLGLFIFPTLIYVAIKDAIISFLYIVFWGIYSKKIINYTEVFNIYNLDIKFIKDSLLGYSLWTHLNGVVTSFIYKSDTFFLSFFVNLSIIGDYNIALTSANVANIIPMIFGYQNSIALSHSKDNKHANEISNVFIRISLYIGIITLLCFTVLGKLYLRIITGQQEVELIYTYMIPIVIGLVLVKTFASPLNAYINIKGSVKSLFGTVLVPVCSLTAFLYFINAKFFGPLGVSITNILVAIVWLLLMIKEVNKYSYNYSSIFDIKKDFNSLRGLFFNEYKRRFIRNK